MHTHATDVIFLLCWCCCSWTTLTSGQWLKLLLRFELLPLGLAETHTWSANCWLIESTDRTHCDTYMHMYLYLTAFYPYRHLCAVGILCATFIWLGLSTDRRHKVQILQKWKQTNIPTERQQQPFDGPITCQPSRGEPQLDHTYLRTYLQTQVHLAARMSNKPLLSMRSISPVQNRFQAFRVNSGMSIKPTTVAITVIVVAVAAWQHQLPLARTKSFNWVWWSPHNDHLLSVCTRYVSVWGLWKLVPAYLNFHTYSAHIYICTRIEHTLQKY